MSPMLVACAYVQQLIYTYARYKPVLLNTALLCLLKNHVWNQCAYQGCSELKKNCHRYDMAKSAEMTAC